MSIVDYVICLGVLIGATTLLRAEIRGKRGKRVSVCTSKEESGLEKHEIQLVNSTGANVVVDKILLRSRWKLWGGEELDLINLVARYSAVPFGPDHYLEQGHPNYLFETKDRTCPWEGLRIIVKLK